jgi:SRSO17 transposase
MTQVLSEKKICKNGYFAENNKVSLRLFIEKYGKLFVVYRRDNVKTAYSYLLGLMKCEKNHTNIERMVEQVPEQAYHQYHNFLSESKWDYQEVNDRTAIEASVLLASCKAKSGKPTGLIIDESSHLKKGNESVAVARQYAGVCGKVDNCQVAVYTSLCNEENTTLIGTSLFLPQKWIEDKVRCDKAGIPVTRQVFQTKPQMALSLIKSNIKLGVKFDWIGGDGLYGHNTELTIELDKERLFYVLDVHKDELIYLEEPSFSIPQKKGTRGATPIKVKADKTAFRIDKYFQNIEPDQWDRVQVRKTAKGWKYVLAHTVAVWHWDGNEDTARARILVITKTEEPNPKVKYSFSNGTAADYTTQEYVYFQCSRYWVERSFDDTKNELGLSGYQVRKWVAWQHHQALVIMASLYMLNVKIEQKPEYELMSIRDARIMIIAHLFSDEATIKVLHDQMIIRHKNRKRDIDRFYKNDTILKV